MHSTMMDVPLTLPYLLEYVGRRHPAGRVVSLLAGDVDAGGAPRPTRHTCTYADVYRRSRQLAAALLDSGLQAGDRVATLATNSYRHLEAYFGVPAAGLVLHTVNIRLHPEQIVYIINHAQDRVLLIDHVLARLLPAIVPHCPSLERVIMLGPLPPGSWTPAELPLHDYDEWISAQDERAFVYPDLDERAPLGMCYTSGTTGEPKGVVYSHRSTVLHSLAIAMPGGLGLSPGDTVLPVVPMFHVMAWGYPWAVPMVGADLALAGIFSDGPTLARLMAEEGVTTAAGVPTIWMGLLAELQRAQAAGTPYDLRALRTLVVGGSAAPGAMIRAFDDLGLSVLHAWGMTETSPFGTAATLPPQIDPRSEEGYHLRAKQGRAPFMVELRLLDDSGRELPHDGHTMGRLLIRGPWVSGGYYHNPEASAASLVELDGPFGRQTWFDTGDIATIDPDGFVSITDRSKDLVKSGGEWISSVDLENALMAHPGVAQAAVIAVPHPKWDERPLAVIVRREGHEVTPEELRAHLEPRFARWWLPDAYAFVDSIPLGATGKFMKRELREQFRDLQLFAEP